MKCPNCRSREFIVYEARGYTSKESPIKECECGHVWRLVPLKGGNKRIDTIVQGRIVESPYYADTTQETKNDVDDEQIVSFYVDDL